MFSCVKMREGRVDWPGSQIDCEEKAQVAGDYKARGLRLQESGVDHGGTIKVDVHGEGNRVRRYLTHNCVSTGSMGSLSC